MYTYSSWKMFRPQCQQKKIMLRPLVSLQRLWFPSHQSFPVSRSVSKSHIHVKRTCLVHEVHQQTTSNKTFRSHNVRSLCFRFFPLYTRLNSVLSAGLMVVTDGQHQRNEAAQNQSSHLHLAQSFAPVPSSRSVAVAPAPDLREDVDGGHIEEGARREEHGDAGGVDVWQSLLAALRGEQMKALRQNSDWTFPF